MRVHFPIWISVISMCIIVGCASRPPLAKTDSLESVIRTLPPKYLADCPYDDRDRFIADLESDEDTFRWDPANKWMNFFSDSGPVPSTSMIYMRIFSHADGSDIVFVHMPKPHADGSSPTTNQTFVLKSGPKGEWLDLTHDLLPPAADLTAHYSPMKIKLMIEVAPYEQFKRADGKGEAYRLGQCIQELWWNGHGFDLNQVAPRPLAEDRVP